VIRRPNTSDRTRTGNALVLVKVVHTVVWAFFVGCIIALPVVALAGRLRLAAWIAGTVLIEVVVLVANRWRCPLTAVAARYTAERRDNFDIYLPLWLARYNKQIFGPLFVAGGLVALWAWLRH
jgi:hypothetical protein